MHEPIFVLRAQDVASASAIDHYQQIASAQGATEYFCSQVFEVEQEFAAWQVNNPDKVKVPDIDEPDEPEPHVGSGQLDEEES